MFSINNRLIVEQYIKEALKPRMLGGIATPGQRDGLKGLTVLMNTRLSDGSIVYKGDKVYIREETLHTQQWASKPFTSELFPESFMIVEMAYVEFVVPKNS